MGLSSINEFKMNFTKIYHQDVKPQLQNFEQERKHTRTIALTASWSVAVLVALVTYFFFFADAPKESGLLGFIFVPAFAIGVGYTVYLHFQKKFERELKASIMPLLTPAFGDFQWLPMSLIDISEIRHSKLFTKFEEKTTDDNFTGSYKNVPIRISETELTYTTRDSKGRRHTHIEFKGILISLEIPKKFVGHTIIKEKSLFGGAPYQEVKLEDPEFSKRFVVRSNDQVEARYLLTTAFMQRYKGIQRAFRGSSICASFLDDKLLLAVSVSKDLFSLGDLSKPTYDTKQFTIFLNEIISIFEMIEDLKLYQDIGM